MKAKDDNENTIYITSIIMLFLFVFIFFIYELFLKNFYEIPACFFYSSFGLYCPACGATRSFLALFHGSILKSIYYNPSVIFSFILFFYYIITQTISRICKKEFFFTIKYDNFYIYCFLFIFILNCIIKNAFNLVYNIPII